MAFNATGLPSIAAATTDLWPSIANTLLVPWRGIDSTAPRRVSRSRKPVETRAQKQTSHSTTLPPSRQASAAQSSRSLLPDFLRDDAELPQSFPHETVMAPTNIYSAIEGMSRPMLTAANPFRHVVRATSRPTTNAFISMFQRMPASTVRTLSTTAVNRPIGMSKLFAGIYVPSQKRSFGSAVAGISRNLLANREAAANRNPSSATAQNAFYQVLLKANMPAIVIERYQSGRYAKNDATEEAFQRAVGMLNTSTGAVGPTGETVGQMGPLAGNSTLSPAQVQAVSQAVAAHTRGSNFAVAKGTQGTGAKDGPIHVVVDESFGGVIFRWVKFILWFCLFTYLSLVIVTMMIEGLSTFKRPGGGRMDNEVKAENQKARFADVHGCEEAKEELQELVEFLRNPDKFSTLGGKLPKGILLVGPPGTGKTLLARAVAGEAGVPFFYMSGSEFDEVYVGVGAKRVRDLFQAARAKSPAIVFIDELDAIGGRRNARDAAYVKQTLNQLLTELDGFEQNSGVIILAATNFPELLDKALTRPGRFDRHVSVDLPDVRGRIAILKHHAQKIKAAPEVDLQSIAMGTSGLSGAELENIVNQAAIHASRAKQSVVTKKDFDWAKDKVIMGAEKKSMVISPKEKEMTAYHEAGHALVNFFNPTSPTKLYKVTVLPRGMSLGHTASLPEMDKYSYSVKDYMASMDVSMGGKIAEEIVYGTDMVTGGASSDLRSATDVAFLMIARLGMSEKLGPVEYGQRYNQLSSDTRALIEAEVQRTLSESYNRAKSLLISKRKELDLLAKALVEYETLDRDEVEKVIRGESLPDRVPVPQGPMIVPKGTNPLVDVPGGLPLPGAADGGEDSPRPPPPPMPPVTGRTTEQ